MVSATSENYLKTIHTIGGSEHSISLGALARALNLTPGTVTTMARQLADDGLVHYLPRRGIRLTDLGRTTAIQIIRRHRIIEVFLADSLGMPASEIHPEAEILEHAFSDHVINLLDKFLDHPAFDPHGSPIPDASGHLRTTSLNPLTQRPEGHRYLIHRFTRNDAEFTDWLATFGFTIGTTIGFHKWDRLTDIVTLETAGGRRIQVGESAASSLLVE
jgi:DtxR family Mn-dependent transcriptional regulator